MQRRTGGVVMMLAAGAFASALVSAGAWQQKPPAKAGASPKLTPVQEKARENYRKTCEPCHGADGKGAPLPGMAKLAEGEWKHGSSVEQIAKTIAEGVPGTVMMPNKDKFTREEILELARLVRSFDPKLKTAK